MKEKTRAFHTLSKVNRKMCSLAIKEKGSNIERKADQLHDNKRLQSAYVLFFFGGGRDGDHVGRD